MKLECIGKLPFGTYAEMERSGVNLNEIDTTDCENSLESLQVHLIDIPFFFGYIFKNLNIDCLSLSLSLSIQVLAQKLYNKDSALVPLTSSSSK